MPDALTSFTNCLSGIASAIGAITSVPTGNKKFERFSLTLKIIAQIIEIVLGIILLAKDIVPNLQEIKKSNSSVHFEDEEGYRDAAYGYIVLFSLEFFMDITIWAYIWEYGQKKYSVGASLFFSIFFEIPIMICILHMMKVQGPIDWDKHVFDLLFQVWFFVNIMLQFTVGYAQKVTNKWHYVTVILMVPLSYLILCLAYAFAILPISTWLSNDIHGTFTSSHVHNMLDFLMFSAYIGQWMVTASPTILLFAAIIYCIIYCIVYPFYYCYTECYE